MPSFFDTFPGVPLIMVNDEIFAHTQLQYCCFLCHKGLSILKSGNKEVHYLKIGGVSESNQG